MKIVIRAGGVGTRLWPWSRSKRPKQFLPIFEGRSCVQVAYQRFTGSGLAEPKDIYVSASRAHAALARGQLPELPEDHLIIEPDTRDTAAAIGLETIVVAGRRGDVVIASLGSDHYVGRPERFLHALRAAERFVRRRPEYLLAIACEPTRVETNYGHIKKGRVLAEFKGATVYEAEEFTEKPNLPTARRYTASGQHLWNANFFVWRAGALMAQFREFEPEMHEAFLEMLSARGRENFARVVRKKYATLKRTAIDYAVLEPASRKGRLAVLPVAMQWSDIGSWATLTDAFPPDARGNLLRGPTVAKNTTNTTVFVTNPRRKLVATIGLDGLAIVDTEDALLVCPKELAGRVKGLVEELGQNTDYRSLT